MTDRDLQDLGLEIEKLLWKKDWEGLNKRYREFNLPEMEIVEIVMWMRWPFAARHKISEWEPFVRRAKGEFIMRGRDPEKLTKGLLE